MNISATQLRQHVHLLSHVKNEDIVVTKREKPFAVIVDFEKYTELVKIYQHDKLDALNSMGSYELGGKSAKQIKAQIHHV